MCDYDHEDLLGCCLLVTAIFFPKVYRLYRKFKNTGDEKTFAELENAIEEILIAKRKGRLQEFIEEGWKDYD